MIKFTNEPMFYIYNILRDNLKKMNSDEIIEFQVLNPDFGDSIYSGTNIEIDGKIHIYRSLNSWNDLAQKLFCKMLIPRFLDENSVVIRFRKLNLNNSFHMEDKSSEKYGVSSQFNSINKNEEPEILSTYLKALSEVKIEKRARVLNLGINSGSEFKLIKDCFAFFLR